MPEIAEDEYLGTFKDDQNKLRLLWRSVNDGKTYNETPKQFWASHQEWITHAGVKKIPVGLQQASVDPDIALLRLPAFTSG